MNTILSNHGYKVIKRELLPKQVKEIKDELNVKPYTFNKNLNKDSRFPIFLESPKKLYLPRFYGVERFGEAKNNTIEEGDTIQLQFNGSLREEQLPIEEIYLKNVYEKGGGII